jgi:hypothetical protein
MTTTSAQTEANRETIWRAFAAWQPRHVRQMGAQMKPRRTVGLDAGHGSLATQPNAMVELIDYAIGDRSAGAAPSVTVASVSP